MLLQRPTVMTSRTVPAALLISAREAEDIAQDASCEPKLRIRFTRLFPQG